MPSTNYTATADLTTKMRYVTNIEIAENAGTPAAARVQLKDGGSSGTLLADIQLAASSSATRSWSKPLYFPNGVYVLVSTGTVRGSIQGT